MRLGAFQRLIGVHALLDAFHHLAQIHEFIANDLVILVQSYAGAVPLGHFQIARAFGLGGEHGADLRTQTLSQILQRCADRQAALGKGRLAAAVHDLQKQFPHGGVDGVADQIGVQCLQNGLADQNFAGHGGGVGHAGTADGLYQRFFNDAVLHVQGQLAGTLLGRAPANTVGQTADVLDLLGLNPFALLRDGGGAVIRALGHRAHMLHFGGIDHILSPFA